MDAESKSMIETVPFDRPLCARYQNMYWDKHTVVPESALVHPLNFWLFRDYVRMQCLLDQEWLALIVHGAQPWLYLPRDLQGRHSPLLRHLVSHRETLSFFEEAMLSPAEQERLEYTCCSDLSPEYIYAVDTLIHLDCSENRKRNVQKFYRSHSLLQFIEEQPGYDLEAYRAVFTRWMDARCGSHESNPHYFDCARAIGCGLEHIRPGDLGSRLFGLWVGNRLVAYVFGMPLRAERQTFCALLSYFDPGYSEANTVALVELAKRLKGDFEYINFTNSSNEGLTRYKRSLNPCRLLPCRELMPKGESEAETQDGRSNR